MGALERAAGIMADRQATYGSPYNNHVNIAKLWSVVLQTEVTPAQAAQCMLMVKQARLIETPDHQDSIDDTAGYTGVYESIIEEEKFRDRVIGAGGTL